MIVIKEIWPFLFVLALVICLYKDHRKTRAPLGKVAFRVKTREQLHEILRLRSANGKRHP